MRQLIFFILLLSIANTFSQQNSGTINEPSSTSTEPSLEDDAYLPPPKETFNKWALNLTFSDNGFGGGATLFHNLNKDVQLFSSIMFSTAKDGREFENVDIYGNTYVPGKVNRLFMVPLNVGVRYRLFREEVSSEMRPFVDGGITPTMIVYTPYAESLLPSFGYAKAKYTVGGFAGVGVDYLTDNTTSLSMNIRYYYIKLFGEGIESLKDREMNYFGGLYFIFSYNFMK
jgi:hypothetical protein